MDDSRMSSSYNEMRPSRTKKVPGRSFQAEQITRILSDKFQDSNASSAHMNSVAPTLDQNFTNIQKDSSTRREAKNKQNADDAAEANQEKKNGRWNQDEKDKFVQGKSYFTVKGEGYVVAIIIVVKLHTYAISHIFWSYHGASTATSFGSSSVVEVQKVNPQARTVAERLEAWFLDIGYRYRNQNGGWRSYTYPITYLCIALRLYGKDWKLVEKFIQTRTGAQIRSHAQKFFLYVNKTKGMDDD